MKRLANIIYYLLLIAPVMLILVAELILMAVLGDMISMATGMSYLGGLTLGAIIILVLLLMVIGMIRVFLWAEKRSFEP